MIQCCKTRRTKKESGGTPYISDGRKQPPPWDIEEHGEWAVSASGPLKKMGLFCGDLQTGSVKPVHRLSGECCSGEAPACLSWRARRNLESGGSTCHFLPEPTTPTARGVWEM